MVQSWADPVHVLTAVARLVAEARESSRRRAAVAVTLRETIPFERLHVLRLDRADSFVLYVARRNRRRRGHASISSAIQPTQFDAADETRARASCARSGRAPACTARSGSRRAAKDAFCTAHQKLMDSVVDLLGPRLRARRHRRARKAAARAHRQPARPAAHDGRRARYPSRLRRGLGGRSRRPAARHARHHVVGRRTARRSASTRWPAPMADPDFFEPQSLSGDDLAQLNRDAYVIHDAEAEVAADSLRGTIFRRFGVRSALRVLMPLGTEVFGSLFFLSRADRSLQRRRRRLRAPGGRPSGARPVARAPGRSGAQPGRVARDRRAARSAGRHADARARGPHAASVASSASRSSGRTCWRTRRASRTPRPRCC